MLHHMGQLEIIENFCWNIKSIKNKEKLIIRSPDSTRPWQHVLDVIFGYMKLAVKLSKNPKLHGEAFNFGPDKNNLKVVDVLKKIKEQWH